MLIESLERLCVLGSTSKRFIWMEYEIEYLSFFV